MAGSSNFKTLYVLSGLAYFNFFFTFVDPCGEFFQKPS